MDLVSSDWLLWLAYLEGLIHQRELYVWAATVMTSRSFPGPAVFNQSKGNFPTYSDNAESKAPVLIPGLDLLNHNPSSRVAWVWDLVTCSIKTDDHLFGESEVPNNYGPKSNEERKVKRCYFFHVPGHVLIDNF